MCYGFMILHQGFSVPVFFSLFSFRSASGGLLHCDKAMSIIQSYDIYFIVTNETKVMPKNSYQVKKITDAYATSLFKKSPCSSGVY